jgi:MFS transporter, DHA1 family, inner membrane transport protein
MWAADAPNLTSALIPAGFNVGIAIGAILGAGVLDAGWGYRSLPLIGVVALSSATVLAVLSALWELRSERNPPASIAVPAQ